MHAGVSTVTMGTSARVVRTGADPAVARGWYVRWSSWGTSFLQGAAFPASDTGAGGTGASGGGTSCLSGGTRRADRSGAGDGPSGPSVGCSKGGPPPATGGAWGTSVSAGTAEVGAAEEMGAVARVPPALSGRCCRSVSSEERGTTGSHLEHQLLGSRGPPTALMLRTSSCSTVDRLAELAGGPRGSEAGIASLEDDGVVRGGSGAGAVRQQVGCGCSARCSPGVREPILQRLSTQIR
mmetsp:Transcript_3567/g.7985  ORF Transcript_3567/g.7985 Transcript_3567/m.7985 type:complete len:238 (+) Transcript_3567:535-1248(+)